MPFLFNPCNPCCSLSTSDAYLAYVAYGNGHIIFAGTPLILGQGNSSTGTARFWLNVKGVMGAGDIGTTQPYTPNGFTSPPLWNMLCAWPTVWGIQTTDDLAGLAMLYTGAIPDNSNAFSFSLPPESVWPNVAAWVANGGVLVVVGRPTSRAISSDFDRLNMFLSQCLGVPSRFTTQNIWPYDTPTSPPGDGGFSMSGIIQDHFLTAGACTIAWGSFSRAFGTLSFTTDPVATITNATPLALVGNVVGAENACTEVYTHGCPEVPLPKTLYSNGYRAQLPLIYKADRWEGIHGVGLPDDWQVLTPNAITWNARPTHWTWGQAGDNVTGTSLNPAGPFFATVTIDAGSCQPFGVAFTAWFTAPFTPVYSRDIEITS
jgi:hypothetical protein